MIKIFLIPSSLAVGLIPFFFASSCTFPISGNSSLERKEIPKVKQADKELRIIESRMIEGERPGWKVTVRDSGLRDERKFFFVDRYLGWAFNKDLFRTEDGGETWESVGASKGENTHLSDVFFFDAKTGWVVEQPVNSRPSESKNQSVLVKRSSDGGQSWSNVAELKGIAITDFVFSSKNIGWLVGRRYYGENPVKFEIYFATTSDGGQSWLDVSGILNSSVSELEENGNVANNISSAAASGDSIIALSGDNQIIRTNDFGQHWKRVGLFPNRDPFIRLSTNRMGIRDDKLSWFVSTSHHYTALSALTIEHDKFWARYELPDVYFSDGVLLSENEIIVCGYRVKSDQGPIGIILHTLDGGRNWRTLIENANTKNIQRLQILSGDQILFWDRNGTIYTLTRNKTHSIE